MEVGWVMSPSVILTEPLNALPKNIEHQEDARPVPFFTAGVPLPLADPPSLPNGIPVFTPTPLEEIARTRVLNFQHHFFLFRTILQYYFPPSGGGGGGGVAKKH